MNQGIHKTTGIIKRMFISVICAVMCCTLFTTRVEAAGFKDDWTSWMQGQSTNPEGIDFRASGCLLTAIAKLLADHGAVPDGFTPDTFAVWALQNGYINKSCWLYSWNIVSDFAAMYGQSVSLTGFEDQIDGARLKAIVLDNARAERHTILSVSNGAHYVYVDNERSLAEDKVYVYDYYFESVEINLNGSQYMARTITVPHTKTSYYPDIRKNQIMDTNAVLYGRVDKSPLMPIETYGITIWEKEKGISSAETKSFWNTAVNSYKGLGSVGFVYDLQNDLGYALKPGTTYEYNVNVKVNYHYYTSEKTEFTTSTDPQFVEHENTKAMYRLYNPNSGEHFYTANYIERNNLYMLGWDYENIGWYAPTEGSDVYRLYNPNAGDHHYTLSAGERDMLVKLGWNDEGVGWKSDDSQTVSLYREYNKNATAGSHNYTPSIAEHNNLIANGWSDEGIAWYGK